MLTLNRVSNCSGVVSWNAMFIVIPALFMTPQDLGRCIRQTKCLLNITKICVESARPAAHRANLVNCRDGAIIAVRVVNRDISSLPSEVDSHTSANPSPRSRNQDFSSREIHVLVPISSERRHDRKLASTINSSQGYRETFTRTPTSPRFFLHSTSKSPYDRRARATSSNSLSPCHPDESCQAIRLRILARLN